MAQARHGRRGDVFGVRLLPEEREAIAHAQKAGGGPRSVGAWMRWAALERASAGVGTTEPGPVVPAPGPGTTGSSGYYRDGEVVPGQVRYYRSSGSTPAPDRLILDLCAGSGSWSAPYESAGYRVVRVTLPDGDVRTFRPPPGVWGVLAAPPCTEFSLAKAGRPRDFVKGMETVNACLRIIGQCSPRWWALENPVGLLRRYLGDPADVWEPCDFGDPWTKRTAIWGSYRKPRRGPWVQPTGSAMDRPTAAERAITPPGFARAFMEANP